MIKNVSEEFKFKIELKNQWLKEVPLSVKKDYFKMISDLQFFSGQKKTIKIIFSSMNGTTLK